MPRQRQLMPSEIRPRVERRTKVSPVRREPVFDMVPKLSGVPAIHTDNVRAGTPPPPADFHTIARPNAGTPPPPSPGIRYAPPPSRVPGIHTPNKG